jgi:hypothetical protein
MSRHGRLVVGGPPLTAYQTYAVNVYFWKQLAVLARDEEHAHSLFESYLASVQIAEENEWRHDPRNRDAYRYRFYEIGHYDYRHGLPSTNVEVMHHGRNN